ncbi:MAG: class I adenylate-forming enzyme family protein [Candidatus Binatia bacterium]
MENKKQGEVPNFDDFLGLTYGQILDKLAMEVPDKEALVFQDQRITYAQFRARVRQMAMALKRLGLRKGDRVGVLFPNCLEFFYVQQGILYVGGVFISLSTRYRKFEITYMMKHAGARFLFCVGEYMGANFIDILEEIRPEMPEMETVVIRGPNVPGWAKPYDEVFALGKDIDKGELMSDPPDAKDIASILYTSGSTGMPKGVMVLHHGLVWNSTRVCERLRIGPDDVFLMMLPCSFIFANFVLFTNAIMGRSKIVIMENFEPGEALRLQESEGVSVLYGVPTMFTLMLGHPEFEKFDLSSNRTGYMSGASCPVELVQGVMQKMYNNISAAYGMTEAACMTITNYEDDEFIKATTAGRPIRGLDLKITGDDRNEVAQGEVGEIAVRGENVFHGYYKQPDLTEASFDSEGFFYTGDLGKLDENGRLIVVGRKKEMISRGGFNVFPAEVEEQIALIEGVQHVAVVGVQDQIMGERICACVVPRPGHQLVPEGIIGFCKDRLANYKVPDFVEIMDSFPMTTTNKIQKFEIKDLLTEKYGKKEG